MPAGVVPSKARASLAIVLTWMLWVAPATAEAAQMDASRPPDVTGPLLEVGGECGGQAHVLRGKTVAVTEACMWVYVFDPLSEADALRDYAVAWLQVTADGRNGWCVTRVASRLRASDNLTIRGWSPRRALRTRRPRPTTIALRARAGGHALEEARLRQDLVVLPRAIEPDSAPQTRSLTWTGRTARKVALAQGIEVSSTSLDLSTRSFRGRAASLRLIKRPGC